MKSLLLFFFLIASLKGFTAETNLEDDFVVPAEEEQLTKEEAQSIYDSIVSTLDEDEKKQSTEQIERQKKRTEKKEARAAKSDSIYKHHKVLHCVMLHGGVLIAASGETGVCYDFVDKDLYVILNGKLGLGEVGAQIRYGFLKYKGATEEVEGNYRGLTAGLHLFFIGAGYTHLHDPYGDRIINMIDGRLGTAFFVNGGFQWTKIYKVEEKENPEEGNYLKGK